MHREMATGDHKVWVIDSTPKRRGRTPSAPPPAKKTRLQPSVLTERAKRALDWRGKAPSLSLPRAELPRVADGPWRQWLLPAVLGPFAAARQATSGVSRTIWLTAGTLPVAIGILAILGASAFDALVETSRFGVALGLALLGGSALLAALAWGFGSFAARNADPAQGPGSEWRNDPRYVGVLGFVFPGFGLQLAGAPRAAAFVRGCMIAGFGSILVLGMGPVAWRRLRSDPLAGISPNAFELVLLAATAVATIAAIVWIVQGLDGMRRVARTRTPLLTDAVSIALLAALTFFSLTFRPADVASNLHAVADALDAQGFRVIPLVLCESSRRLDQSTPRYAADTIDLLDGLGRHDAADVRRRELERRMIEYLDVLGHRETFMQAAARPGQVVVQPATYGPMPQWSGPYATYE
ncbi:MAG: hypothetical protein R3B81_02160 [bacterium]